MSNTKIKICPRCQLSFECKSADIKNCQCELVELQPPQRDFISKQYDDCLCVNCLKQLSAEQS